MIKNPASSIVINLDGPNGNAFYLLGVAGQLAKKLDLNESSILDEMKSGDYTNLVKVFDRYFGKVVTLETTQEALLEAN